MIFGTITFTAILAYAGYALRAIPNRLLSFIIQIISFNITITSNNRTPYIIINRWIMELDSKILKNNINTKISFNDDTGIRNYISTINYGRYIIKLDWKTIMIINKDMLDKRDDIVDSMKISIIGRNKKRYRNHILELISKENNADKIRVTPSSGEFDTFLLNKKSFDDVFSPEKGKIINHINRWLSNKDFYNKHGIIYKTGILLYGEPGTGKTTMARAIASYLDYRLYIISLKSFPSENALVQKILSISGKAIILLEDIDCILNINRDNIEDEREREKNEALLGTTLNILDGAISPENAIFIATTNHIEVLDQALIRSGRFDLKLEIGNIDREYAEKMCDRFEADNSILNNETFPINPSYLQNKIFENIIKEEE